MARLAVVISQGQSANPVKRKLEEDVVTGLMLESGLDLIVVPHLYDLSADHTGTLALTGIPGHVVVLSWLYERACRWTLDRLGVRGKEGVSELKPLDDDEEEESSASAEEDAKERVADERPVPHRRIYCLDLRARTDATPFIEEVKRIARESNLKLMDLGLSFPAPSKPSAEQLARLQNPTNDTALPLHPHSPSPASTPIPADQSPPAEAEARSLPLPVVRIDADTERRWYPVIDYSRCTNCMECIDFCLFGVYGVDTVETILVEQPDNCRKGCPACSRVCPENAIIFPQHKTPAIAGAELGASESLKIDLSKLFGAPEKDETAEQAALRERDEQLLLAGRHAVGTSTSSPQHSSIAPVDDKKDKLDSLIDELDSLDI